MKKFLCAALTTAMVATCCIPALAEEGSETAAATSYDEFGMSFELTDEFINTKGIFFPSPNGEMDNGLFLTTFAYYAVPREELKAISEKAEDEYTAEDIGLVMKMAQNATVVLYTIADSNGRSPSEILDALEAENISEDDMIEIGSAEDTKFYILEDSAETEKFLADAEPEYAEEYKALHDSLTDILKNAEFSVPDSALAEIVGDVLSFETTDIDGNVVNSSDIFKENKVTMINIWGTWCHFCVEEMEELGELHRRLADKGAAIIGICEDAASKMDECRQILEENNVDYLNLLPFEGWKEALPVTGFPTTYFVDSEGRILGSPITGKPEDIAEYENKIDEYLAGDAEEEPAAEAAQESNASGYRVIVKDTEGAPVVGAVVQFCSDNTCLMGETDENGVAAFDTEEGSYTVHILQAPEGYEGTDEEFVPGETYGDLNIVLEKAA